MNIYKHKKEGYVAFWGTCQMRTATGQYKAATMYRKLELTDKGADMATEGNKSKASLLDQVYVVPTGHWKKYVKPYGVVRETQATGKGDTVEADAQLVAARQAAAEQKAAAAAAKAAKMVVKMRDHREKYGSEMPESDAICKGAYALGSACGICMECVDARNKTLASLEGANEPVSASEEKGDPLATEDDNVPEDTAQAACDATQEGVAKCDQCGGFAKKTLLAKHGGFCSDACARQ